MKHFTKILLLCLCVAVFFSLAACSDGDNSPANDAKSEATSLTLSAKELATAVTSKIAFTDMSLITSDEEDADLTLIFSYGVDDDAWLEAIEDYALGTLSSNAHPYYIGIIRTKEGTDTATVDAIAEAVRSAYPEYVISQMDQYNNAWSDVAKAFTLKTYENGIVVVAYDEDGNEAIFNLINETCAK